MAAQIMEAHAKLDEELGEAKVQVRKAAKRRKRRQADGAHWLPHIPMSNEARLREYQRKGEELRLMMRHMMDDARAQPSAFGADTGTTGGGVGGGVGGLPLA